MQEALNAAIKATEQSIFTRFAKADFAMFDAVENAKVSFFGKCQRKATKPRNWQMIAYLYIPNNEAVEVVPIRENNRMGISHFSHNFLGSVQSVVL